MEHVTYLITATRKELAKLDQRLAELQADAREADRPALCVAGGLLGLEGTLRDLPEYITAIKVACRAHGA